MGNSSRLSEQKRRWRSTLESLEARHLLTTVSGTTYEDVNDNGAFDPADESGIPDVVVFADLNGNGTLDQGGFGFDPDEFEEGEVLNNSRQAVFPSATGDDNVPTGRVLAVTSPRATTGDRSFAPEEGTTWESGQRIRFDFTLPVSSVSLDVVGADGVTQSSVRLDAYSSADTILAIDVSNPLGSGDTDRLRIGRMEPDIAYVVASVIDDGAVSYDNLRADDDFNSEPSTVTSSIGFYRLLDLPQGEIAIVQAQPEGYAATSPASGQLTVNVQQAIGGVDFGNRTATISGLAFADRGETGEFDGTVDRVLPNAPVYLDTNLNGMPDERMASVDPDEFLPNQVLEFVADGLRLTTVNESNEPLGELVVAAADTVVSPDGQILTREGDPTWNSDRRLRVDFTSPASRVTIDFVAAAEGDLEQGVLTAFSASGDEIASTTSNFLTFGQMEQLSIEREGFDIGYVVAYTAGEMAQGRLDNIQATLVDEPVAVANDEGEYIFKPLDGGEYRVGALPVTGRELTFPEAEVYDIEVEIGESELAVDFGFLVANEPPVAVDDSASGVEDTPISVGVIVNDSDPDGTLNPGSVTIQQQPLNGEATTTADGLIIYTPNDDFFGTDTLIYTVLDDQGAESNSAIVTLQVAGVNDPPVAVDDSVSVLLSSPTTLSVIRNDVDIDGTIDPSTISIVTNPTNGSLEIDPTSGNISYTPSSSADDSFSYTVEDNDGLVSNVATVTITSLATGTSPTLTNDTATTLEGTRVTIDVLANDSDPDGTIDPSSLLAITQPANGSATVVGNEISYQPNLGFIGEDTFLYQVRDNTGLAGFASVRVTMTERDFPYQNPIDNLDVNNDGFVIPRDALIIINEINDRQVSNSSDGSITVGVPAGETPVAWMDINGDGFIVARDVLLIVNFLNGLTPAAAPTDASMVEPEVAAAAAVFASDFDAFEDDDEETV